MTVLTNRYHIHVCIHVCVSSYVSVILEGNCCYLRCYLQMFSDNTYPSRPWEQLSYDENAAWASATTVIATPSIFYRSDPAISCRTYNHVLCTYKLAIILSCVCIMRWIHWTGGSRQLDGVKWCGVTCTQLSVTRHERKITWGERYRRYSRACGSSDRFGAHYTRTPSCVRGTKRVSWVHTQWLRVCAAVVGATFLWLGHDMKTPGTVVMRSTFPQYFYVFIASELVLRIPKNTKISTATLYGTEIFRLIDATMGWNVLLAAKVTDHDTQRWRGDMATIVRTRQHLRLHHTWF